MGGDARARTRTQRVSEVGAGAVRIRPARMDDIDAIVAIERASFSDPWSAKSFRELLAQGNVVCAVAVRGDVRESVEAAGRARGGTSEGGADGASSGPATASAPAIASATAPATELEVVGFAVLYLSGREGDLANLASASSARRAGVGRQLLEHVLEAARARGAQTIFLEVRESNGAARALYSSAGFVDVGRRKKYYARPVEDALVLKKELS